MALQWYSNLHSRTNTPRNMDANHIPYIVHTFTLTYNNPESASNNKYL